ncbi:ral guanine nucleotide dissociation stimulator-like [Cavia porcellus]|uniref:ral guanine nucleotide dissociation stimulator-like n=1 Tax=Cavia porcellus TaxID=10141 RepID=UPI002FE11EF8
MFSCCFPKREGSGHKSWWREGVIQRLRGSGSRQAQSLEHTDPRTPKMTQDPRKSSPKLEDAGKVGSMEPDMLKKLVFNLVLAHQRGDPFFVPAFLAIYRRFATTRQVLDLLFLRCAPPPSQGARGTLGALGDEPPETFCTLIFLRKMLYSEDSCS